MPQYSSFTTSYGYKSNRLINEAYIRANGEDMYAPNAQWDTGATGTCISKAVVDRLGLVPVSQTMIYTPSGDRVLDVYVVDIVLRNNVMVKDVLVIGTEIGNQGIDLLIGMDIIGLGDFAVTNLNGETQFSFRIPSAEKIDFVNSSV